VDGFTDCYPLVSQSFVRCRAARHDVRAESQSPQVEGSDCPNGAVVVYNQGAGCDALMAYSWWLHQDSAQRRPTGGQGPLIWEYVFDRRIPPF
jgi:hypothetical protein